MPESKYSVDCGKAASLLLEAKNRRPDLTFKLDELWDKLVLSVNEINFDILTERIADLEKSPVGKTPTDKDFSEHGYRPMGDSSEDEDN
jgi:hypothetical protein